jgi:membrane fusion protein (multidrug efflux system)
MHARVDPAVTPSRWRTRALMLSVPLLVAAAGLWLWLSGLGEVSTDNAYLRVDKVAISSDVSGRVQDVLATENMPVKRGQLLIRLAPLPFQIALDEAEARLAAARLQVQQLKSGTGGSAADVAGKREAVRLAQAELERQRQLLERGFATRARLQQAEYDAANARAELNRALAEDASARQAAGSSIAVEQHPLVREARAARDRAALDLARSAIRAPADGIVTQTSRLQPGQAMIQGVATLSLMVTGSAYVEANFKETDLEDMAVGQRAQVTLDAFPKRPLSGRVESIGVGTGGEFSVLPAQNATGNWVKVVQRVPVRIRLERPPADLPLIAGLSAQVKVITR